jgi:hypothetical protein
MCFCLQMWQPPLVKTVNLTSRVSDKQRCLEENERCSDVIPVLLSLYYFPTPLFSHFTPQQVSSSLTGRTRTHATYNPVSPDEYKSSQKQWTSDLHIKIKALAFGSFLALNGISSEGLNMNRMVVRGRDRKKTHFPCLQILNKKMFTSHVQIIQWIHTQSLQMMFSPPFSRVTLRCFQCLTIGMKEHNAWMTNRKGFGRKRSWASGGAMMKLATKY